VFRYINLLNRVAVSTTVRKIYTAEKNSKIGIFSQDYFK
jgi:hypothetical protein